MSQPEGWTIRWEKVKYINHPFKPIQRLLGKTVTLNRSIAIRALMALVSDSHPLKSQKGITTLYVGTCKSFSDGDSNSGWLIQSQQ